MRFRMGLFKLKFKSNIPTETINKLTLIRFSGNDNALIEQEMQEEDYGHLLVLISELSEKIQKINIIKSKGHVEFRKSRKKLNALVNDIFNANKFDIIQFAGQLLQYYTILCDDAFKPESSFIEFQKFLEENEDTFGSVATNLFVIEYKLIKIYNDLSQLGELYKDINPFSDNEPHPSAPIFKELSGALGKLEHVIDNTSPQNIFFQYLRFIYYYTEAKATEIEFNLHCASYIDKEPTEWIDIQRKQLRKAKTSLNTIDTLVKFYSNKKNQAGSGLEYSLGRPLFALFPEKNVSNLSKHIDGLLQQ